MNRVLHIQLFPMLSGAQKVSLDEFLQLSNEFHFSLICKEHGALVSRALELGVDCQFVPTLCREVNPIKDLRSLYALYKLIKMGGFDIVHTHSSKTGVLGRLAAKMAGVKLVVHTVHGFSFPAAKGKFQRWLFRSLELFARRFTDRLIVLNSSDEKIAVMELGFDSDVVKVIPNGIDLDVYRPMCSQDKRSMRNKSMGLPGEVLMGVMVGRLCEQKNPNLVLEALGSLAGSNLLPNDFQFHFIGDGPLRESLENRAHELNLAHVVVFKGWITDVHKLLPAYDFLVLPSRWEGLPLAVLEGMACGLPCIVSDIPANGACVTNEVEGYLFGIDSVQGLATALVRIFSLEERRRLSLQARSRVEAEFAISKRTRSVKALYLCQY